MLREYSKALEGGDEMCDTFSTSVDMTGSGGGKLMMITFSLISTTRQFKELYMRHTAKGINIRNTRQTFWKETAT